MLSLNNNFKNSFFDDLFFNRDRNMAGPKSTRLESKKPGSNIFKSLQPRRESRNKPNRDELRLILFIDDDFFGGELNLFKNTNRFFDDNSHFDVQEDADNYFVSSKYKDIKNKVLNVKYLKEEQELVVSSKIKKCDKYNDGDGNSESTFSSTTENRIRLSKPVEYEAIKATIDNDCLKLTIPKLETDETIFRIEIDKNEDNDEEQKVITPAITEINESSKE